MSTSIINKIRRFLIIPKLKKILTDATLQHTQTYIIAMAVFYFIVLFVPFFNNTYNLPKLVILQIGTSVVVIIEALRIIISRNKRYFVLSDILLLLFLSVNFFSYVFSKSRDISLWGFYNFEGLNFYYLIGMVSFVWVYKRLPADNRHKIKSFIIAATLLSSIYVIYKYLDTKLLLNIPERPLGFDGHPIWTSGTIGFGLMILLDRIFTSAENAIKRKIVNTVLICIYILALYYLMSATTFLSLISTFLIAMFLHIMGNHAIALKTKILHLIIAGFIIGLAITYFIPKKEFSLNKRAIELRTAVTLMRNEFFSPVNFNAGKLLFGHGQNTSGLYYIRYKDSDQNLDKEWFANLTHLHQHMLELFFTTGILGILTWLGLFYYATKIKDKKQGILGSVILIYSLLWQQLYFLLPSVLMLSMLMLFDNTIKEKYISFSLWQKINIRKSVFILLVILYSINIKQSMDILSAEFFYSRKNIDLAIRKAPYNEDYSKTKLLGYQHKIVTCQSNLESDKKNLDCTPAKLQETTRYLIAGLESIIDRNPINPMNWHAYNTAAFVSYLAGNRKDRVLRDKALEAGAKSIAMNPTDSFFLNDYGIILLDDKNYPEAEKIFLRSYNLKPDNIATTRHLIELYKQWGNKKLQKLYEDKLRVLDSVGCKAN